MTHNLLRSLGLLIVIGLSLAARPTDVLTDLRLSSDDLREVSIRNMTSDGFTVPDLTYNARQWAKKLSAPARAEAVRALGQIVRAYTETADFRNRYDEWMQQKYNVSDARTQQAAQIAGTSTDEVKQAYDQALAQTHHALAQMDPSMHAMMLQSQMQVVVQAMNAAEGHAKAEKAAELAELKKLQALSRSNPAEFRKQYPAYLNQYLNKAADAKRAETSQQVAVDKQQAAEYQKRLAEYNANANPNLALKQKLRAFISLAQSFDFDAKVVQQGNRIEFVDPAYRSRSDDWKRLYRMGKEPVTTARLFAQGWLLDLESTANR